MDAIQDDQVSAIGPRLFFCRILYDSEIRCSPIRTVLQKHYTQPQLNADSEDEHVIGAISDTHNLIRLEALYVLKGSERIIHAGDIGGPEILEVLKVMAPVVAVRGNNDQGEWARRLPKVKVVEFNGARIAVVHILRDLDNARSDCKLDCILDCRRDWIISGHSHRAPAKRKNRVLCLNQGTAGSRRFGQPATIALLRIFSNELNSE